MESKSQVIQDKENLSYLKPPLEAFLYFPPENLQVEGKEKQILRWFFEGNVRFLPFQYERIEKFKAYIVEQKQEACIKGWTIPNILKFIEACSWKNDQTVQAIKQYNEWTIQTLPVPFDEEVQYFLDSGLMYVHGRDHRFRPIIIFNAFQIDLKNQNEDQLIQGITYLLEVVQQYFFIPGQVENWVLIMDLNGAGLSNLSTSTIQQIVQYLSNTYRSKLYRFYSVNSPGSITIPWAAVKIFLDDHTCEQIKFIKTPVPEKLYHHAHPSQVEQRFGGTAENVEQNFWPPILIDDKIFTENDNPQEILVSREQYVELYQNQMLEGCQINNEIISSVPENK